MGTPVGHAHRVTPPVRTDPTGRTGPTRRQAAGPAWRRTSHGLYVPADVAPTPTQRVVEAGVLVPASGAAVTGWAALCWRGARWHTGTHPDGSPCPVDVASPTGAVRHQPLLRVSRERFDAGSVEVVDGLRLVPAVDAVAFAMRHAADVDRAVEALDMAYRANLVTPEDIAGWIESHPAYVGIQRARDALPLADQNAWSPREVHARLAWERARGTRPLTNPPLFDLSGRHIGTPDLLDPVTGVCGEYDGDHHLDRDQRRKDLTREQRFLDHGLTPFTVMAGDLRSGQMLRRLHSAHERAARVRPEERRWTTELPGWWTATMTVAQRRAGPMRWAG